MINVSGKLREFVHDQRLLLLTDEDYHCMLQDSGAYDRWTSDHGMFESETCILVLDSKRRDQLCEALGF